MKRVHAWRGILPAAAILLLWMQASALAQCASYCSGSVTLTHRDSYDFASGEIGTITGGDLYLHEMAFLANNVGQRGVLSLGDIGQGPLCEVDPPESGYTRFGVDALEEHTYVSLAHDRPDGRIVLRVLEAGEDHVFIEYLCIEVSDPEPPPYGTPNSVLGTAFEGSSGVVNTLLVFLPMGVLLLIRLFAKRSR